MTEWSRLGEGNVQESLASRQLPSQGKGERVSAISQAELCQALWAWMSPLVLRLASNSSTGAGAGQGCEGWGSHSWRRRSRPHYVYGKSHPGSSLSRCCSYSFHEGLKDQQRGTVWQGGIVFAVSKYQLMTSPQCPKHSLFWGLSWGANGKSSIVEGWSGAMYANDKYCS